jgi:hypothetical protein
MMRPWNPEDVKILNDAHVEMLRGKPWPSRRRRPRPN